MLMLKFDDLPLRMWPWVTVLLHMRGCRLLRLTILSPDLESDQPKNTACRPLLLLFICFSISQLHHSRLHQTIAEQFKGRDGEILLSFVLPPLSSHRDFLQPLYFFSMVFSLGENGSPFHCQENTWEAITSILLHVHACKGFTVEGEKV